MQHMESGFIYRNSLSLIFYLQTIKYIITDIPLRYKILFTVFIIFI